MQLIFILYQYQYESGAVIGFSYILYHLIFTHFKIIKLKFRSLNHCGHEIQFWFRWIGRGPLGGCPFRKEGPAVIRGSP